MSDDSSDSSSSSSSSDSSDSSSSSSSPSLSSQYASYGSGRAAAESATRGYTVGTSTGSGSSSASQYAAYGEGRSLAEHMAGYGEGATPKSEWQTYLDTRPKLDPLKTSMGMFFSPLSTIAKVAYATETARQNMSEAERNNFDNVTAQMTASQQNTGRGGYTNSIQSAYAPRSVNSNIPGGISGVASGSVTGGAYFAPDVDKTGAASAGANGSAGGVVSVTQGESQWAKWAAFATVAGVLYEIYKG